MRVLALVESMHIHVNVVSSDCNDCARECYECRKSMATCHIISAGNFPLILCACMHHP